MPDRITPEQLLAQLAQGELVVFPRERAAKSWRARYDRVRRADTDAGGPAAWEPARAVGWSQWTSGLWNQLVLTGAETRLLLNAAQEHQVWREVVGAKATDSLAPQDALAKLAAEAWSLAAKYGAVDALPRAANTTDSRTFAEWAAVFQRRCARGEMLSTALLEDALSGHAEAGRLRLDGELTLVGFLEATPSQRALLDVLQQHGARVRTLELAHEDESSRTMAVAKTEAEELIVAARWVRDAVRVGKRPVAMIVPGLGEERAALGALLRHELAPEIEAIGADVSSTPWEMSAGQPLSSIAMVQAAVNILDWLRGALPFERISALLLSAYVGDAAESAKAAVFDVEVLRRAKPLRPEADAAQVLAMGVPPKPAAPAWIAAFDAYRRSAALDGNKSYAEWMGVFRGALRACGWPGTRARTAMEFEAMRAFDAVMDTVATLDFDGARPTLRDATSALQRLVRQTAMTGPATDAPVQVMTLEESAGAAFDAVVMVRATDVKWPAREAANPLIAWGLQKSLEMPGTDAAATTARALRRGEDLLARCGEALFLCAEENADGKLRPSPLLGQLGLQDASLPDVASDDATLAMERVVDDAPLAALPTSFVRGGSSVLKAQAACGFRAFAEYRLQAREMDAFALGMDAPESGSRVHDALGAFWSEVKTLKALRGMSDSERARVVRKAVAEAMARHQRATDSWDTSFVEMQQQRLFALLEEWLVEERKRSPFAVVRSEFEERIAVGPLEMNVRFDRIDRLDGDANEFVLVDYKTGLAGQPKDWEGERPDDPQLPMYSLQAQPGELQAIAFGKVRAGEMKWMGKAAREDILPASRGKGTITDIDELVEEWRAVLTQLAMDFAEGRADVDPKEYPRTCERCAIRLVCRVNPESLQSSEEDEAEDIDG